MIDLFVSLLGTILGIGDFFATTVRLLLDKNNLLQQDRKHAKNIADKISELTESLNKSGKLMAEIEAEFEKQKVLAEKWKEEAETSQIIASLNQQEVEAVTKIFGNKIEKENKKSGRISILWGAFFCVIGLVGGFLLSRIVP